VGAGKKDGKRRGYQKTNKGGECCHIDTPCGGVWGTPGDKPLRSIGELCKP